MIDFYNKISIDAQKVFKTALIDAKQKLKDVPDGEHKDYMKSVINKIENGQPIDLEKFSRDLYEIKNKTV